MLTYDVKKVVVAFGGVTLEGYMSGSKVNIAYKNEMFILTIGCDGSGSRGKTNDLSARVTVRLQQTSKSNDFLTGCFVADGESAVGAPLPLMISDKSGRSLFVSESAYLVKLPDADYAPEVGERVWVIETDALVANVAGN